ncbi:GntR family transcriptional regulator [Actinocorallia sp. API 0066]|uniref:FadR/GntR family transcriptional regulator n=1 Tax=Actinocorallia sp. API 0066 TaxID=2896846 RepID=UPI001E3B561A|nr:GntR family transcriptional regulator [Actinocorallia sp. API 0066]MCD0449788.1 GntR family transcriptional regulator [Actinocorallia sp. API 0066]
MEIVPIERASLSDGVFAALVEQILDGRVAAGAALPSERELAVAFGVNRHAVREALKRLQQAGLVRIAQGGRTRVRNWREHAELDLLAALAATGAVPAADLLHDISVMRRAVGADAAGWCARRATEAELRAVVEAAAAYPERPIPLPELIEIDLRFWTAVVDGSHNIAYRLGLNTLVAALAAIGMEHVTSLVAEMGAAAAHRELAGLIAAREGDAARALAERLMDPTPGGPPCST